jgi:outer membrane receptor protein involved in Fe transport
MTKWITLIIAASAAMFDCAVEAAGADSLAFTSEVLVITREELSEYNIHTVYDILELVPGAIQWSEGPVGSRGGFSLDARGYTGVMLLLNGEPMNDPYSAGQLARFIPLSRLERVEVYYQASPFLTGNLSAGAAVNIVLEDGGRGAPAAELDFTYGRGNRRARRIWFATPRARADALIAYDEYLQDASDSYLPDPNLKLGKYNSRSIMMALRLNPETGHEVRIRLHRFEDTYVGTAYTASEDVRYDGYDAGLGYRHGPVDIALRQRVLSLSRRFVRTSAFLLGGVVRLSRSIAGMDGQLFVSAERSSFENVMNGKAYDPSLHRVEAGFRAAWRTGRRLGWRIGYSAGDQSETGRYSAGEAGLSWAGEAIAAHIASARRVRIPSPYEMFQPDSILALGGKEYLPGGNPGIEPELTEEVELGATIYRALSIDLFARRERRRIAAPDTAFSTVDGGDVTGVRGRYVGRYSLFGFDCRLNASLERFGERSGFTPGIPEYRAVGGLLVRRAVFKQTETLSLRWDTEFVGERSWDGTKLDDYMLHDLSCSLTILKARLVFQYKNLLNTEYETVPGFSMPGRHYIVGIWWELID